MRLLTFLLCFALAPCVAGAGDAERLLDIVEKSALPLESFSLLALELGENGPVTRLSLHPHVAKNPASTTKLITAAVTLREIPSGTRFSTRVLADGPVDNGVLRGNLILQGGGDPSFVSETLWLLVNRLRQVGLTAVEGDIIVDDSYFDTVLIDPGRDTKRSEHAYDAPISAMSFNWNSAQILIRPGRLGTPPQVLVEPASDYFTVDNRATTAPGSSIAQLKLLRRPQPDAGGDMLVVSGSLGVHAGEYDTRRNITQPALWSGLNLKHYLGYMDIPVTGEVVRSSSPVTARELASVDGRPVEQLVIDMNKVSSNFIAEMLTKAIAARRSAPGTMSAGLDIMQEYMASLGVDPSEYLLVNPAGLTYTNRLSANALVRVLHDAMQDFRIAPEFTASLPIAGLDGTLERRMRDTPAQGWVRAKTGYVEGSVSLAGFAQSADGNPIVYAFLYNGPASAQKVRALYDELSTRLVSTGDR